MYSELYIIYMYNIRMYIGYRNWRYTNTISV